MNHLEQLVAEWLQYNGYFVRVSVHVGKRAAGGFEGELDVVAVHFARKHMLHVECSLDALPDAKRQERFTAKFERGRAYFGAAFEGVPLPDGTLEQICILQFASGKVTTMGGARLVTVHQFIHEIYRGLAGTSPSKSAVPSNLPLIRTLQLAAFANNRGATAANRLVPEVIAEEVRSDALGAEDDGSAN